MFSSVNNKDSTTPLNRSKELAVKKEDERIDHFARLPPEMILEIFSYLKNRKDLLSCTQVCLRWHQIANIDTLWKSLKPPSIAFGKDLWQKFLGEVEEEPPLPRNIDQILESPCPFFKRKKVKETHMLVLIPSTVNGKPLTLNSFSILVKNIKAGNKTRFSHLWNHVVQEYGNASIQKSYWVLMTKNVIPWSRNENYANQEVLVRDKDGYDVPCILDLVVCIFTKYVSSGKSKTRLFSEGNKTNDYVWTYTRCQGEVNGIKLTAVVGGYSIKGLGLHQCNGDDDSDGIAAARKFVGVSEVRSGNAYNDKRH